MLDRDDNDRLIELNSKIIKKTIEIELFKVRVTGNKEPHTVMGEQMKFTVAQTNEYANLLRDVFILYAEKDDVMSQLFAEDLQIVTMAYDETLGEIAKIFEVMIDEELEKMGITDKIIAKAVYGDEENGFIDIDSIGNDND